MIILQIVLIIFPGIFAMGLHLKLSKQRGNLYECFNLAIIYVLQIMLMNYILVYLRGNEMLSFDHNFSADIYGTKFVIKYMSSSIVWAIAMPWAYNCIIQLKDGVVRRKVS